MSMTGLLLSATFLMLHPKLPETHIKIEILRPPKIRTQNGVRFFKVEVTSKRFEVLITKPVLGTIAQGVHHLDKVKHLCK